MSKKKTKAILLVVDAIIAAILIVLDQIIKAKVVETLVEGKEQKFIPGVIYLLYLKNTGAAFSSFQNQKWLLLLISILFMAILAFVIVKLPLGKKFLPANILFSLVIAGGIGNMIDRIKQSYVVDYLGFDFWRSYPIFNFADICVVLGVVGLFILFLFVYNEKDLDFLRIFKGKQDTKAETVKVEEKKEETEGSSNKTDEE